MRLEAWGFSSEELAGDPIPLLDSIILRSELGWVGGSPGGGWKSIVVIYFFLSILVCLFSWRAVSKLWQILTNFCCLLVKPWMLVGWAGRSAARAPPPRRAPHHRHRQPHRSWMVLPPVPPLTSPSLLLSSPLAPLGTQKAEPKAGSRYYTNYLSKYKCTRLGTFVFTTFKITDNV